MRPYIPDTWQGLSFKTSVFGNPGDKRPPSSRSWVDDFDARRLAAYTLLGAYRENTAANHLPDPGPLRMRELLSDMQAGTLTEPADYREKYREYGDAGLLVVTGRSLLLGDDQTIDVPAAHELTDGDNPQPTDAAKRAAEFAEWLDEWSVDAMLLLRLLEMELNAVGDGDGCLVLGWNGRRPTLRKYDPGVYFPDLTTLEENDEDAGGFPSIVHIAWEYADRAGHEWLRRQSWALVPTEQPWRPAYAEEGDEPATLVCVRYDRRFDLRRLREGDTVYTLPLGAGEGPDPVTMPIDYMPVVHVPNDSATEGHFGRSLLLGVAQIVDDLSATDSDLQGGSALAGSTPLVTKGIPGALPGGPGSKIDLPDGGDARLLDTSRVLDALLKYDEHLLDRLSTNSRIAAALLGRVKPNEVASGYLFDLGMRSTANLIREMRLVRNAKYPLLLKMAMRLAQAHDKLPAGPTPRATIELGPFLPADKTGVAERIARLLPAHGMSVETAVAELQQAGFAIDDAAEEVQRILRQWGALAVQAVDATGDPNAGRRILGIPELPTPVLPEE